MREQSRPQPSPHSEQFAAVRTASLVPGASGQTAARPAPSRDPAGALGAGGDDGDRAVDGPLVDACRAETLPRVGAGLADIGGEQLHRRGSGRPLSDHRGVSQVISSRGVQWVRNGSRLTSLPSLWKTRSTVTSKPSSGVCGTHFLSALTFCFDRCDPVVIPGAEEGDGHRSVGGLGLDVDGVAGVVGEPEIEVARWLCQCPRVHFKVTPGVVLASCA